MRFFRNGPAAWGLAAAILAASGLASARAETILSCQLSVDEGEPANPPATLFLRVAPDTYEDFRDGAWGRNFCGPHGGEAPDAECFIQQGAFRVDWVWKSNVGRLERHVLLDLGSGELTDSDHNGVERKGVCKPAPDPAVQRPSPAVAAQSAPQIATQTAPLTTQTPAHESGPDAAGHRANAPAEPPPRP